MRQISRGPKVHRDGNESFRERRMTHVLITRIGMIVRVGQIDDIYIVVRDRGGFDECIGRVNEGQDVNHAVIGDLVKPLDARTRACQEILGRFMDFWRRHAPPHGLCPCALAACFMEVVVMRRCKAESKVGCSLATSYNDNAEWAQPM